MVSEEDIKKVEKFIKAFKTDDTKSVCGFDVQAIERLLQGYKELKKNYINPSEMRISYYDTKKGTTVVIEGFIPKSLVEEAKQKIEKARDLANELIEHKVVIADSDSLYSGERRAHDYDLSLLEELLKGDK